MRLVIRRGAGVSDGNTFTGLRGTPPACELYLPAHQLLSCFLYTAPSLPLLWLVYEDEGRVLARGWGLGSLVNAAVIHCLSQDAVINVAWMTLACCKELVLTFTRIQIGRTKVSDAPSTEEARRRPEAEC